VPIAHTCNPSYSADREKENHSSKPVQANSLFTRPCVEKIIHTHKKKSWWGGSRWRPLVQTPVPQKNKNKQTNKFKCGRIKHSEVEIDEEIYMCSEYAFTYEASGEERQL
jgi:hypothetical protein